MKMLPNQTPNEEPRFKFQTPTELCAQPESYFTDKAQKLVDLSEAKRFLDMLAPGETEFTFQIFSDDDERKAVSRARIFHGTLDQCASKLALANDDGCGIFVTINRTDLQGRKAENVVAVRAFFVDLDGAPLEPVLAAPVPPDIVVESSPGRYHAYWKVAGIALEQFKPTQQALAARFGSDVSVCDLPRVLRLPGFWHRKGKAFMTRILSSGSGDDLI